MNLIIAIILVFIINIPAGYWRGGLRKFSLWWFVSIHLPIPFVVLIRLGFDIGFALYSYPIFIFAFFSGQFLGKYIYKYKTKKK